MKKAFWIVLVFFTLSIFGNVPAMAAAGHGKSAGHQAAGNKHGGHGKKQHKKHKAKKKLHKKKHRK